MTKRLFSSPCLAALALAGLSACAPSTPQFDRHFGETVRAALASQVLDPAAAANRDPVAGIDGRSATAALERYRKSFAEPAGQQINFMIGSGGGK
jgi:type IV pilus biogenesis protein CpaD/CtpE